MQFPIVISGGNYGYKNSSGTFVAFRGDSTATYTYASGSTGGTVDLGARNTYRYVNATNVYNKGKADGNSSIINGTLSFVNTTATVNIGRSPKLFYIVGPYDGGVRHYSFIYDTNHSTAKPIIARYAYQGGNASRSEDIANGQQWSADGVGFTLTVNNTGFTFSIDWSPFRQATNYYGIL